MQTISKRTLGRDCQKADFNTRLANKCTNLLPSAAVLQVGLTPELYDQWSQSKIPKRCVSPELWNVMCCYSCVELLTRGHGDPLLLHYEQAVIQKPWLHFICTSMFWGMTVTIWCRLLRRKEVWGGKWKSFKRKRTAQSPYYIDSQQLSPTSALGSNTILHGVFCWDFKKTGISPCDGKTVWI